MSARILFCNIGWMNRYEGLEGKPDKIVGGGSYVDKNSHGGEVCNFKACGDGFVYGHVETIKGETDRRINITDLGGSGDFVKGIDVVWTATDPDERGRRVVGWYRNAMVFRERQVFDSHPSKQHERDKLDSFRVRALPSDTFRVELENRILTLSHGKGWMGQTPWWSPDEDSSNEVLLFMEKVRASLGGKSGGVRGKPIPSARSDNSSGTATDPYSRYIEAHEIQISPRHNDLQNRFADFIGKHNGKDIQHDKDYVDLRYVDHEQGFVLAEIKPCDIENARFAIRTAIGQLLDYRQSLKNDPQLLIVLEVKPNDRDALLARSNGFALAYPEKDGFRLIWPNEQRR